MKVTIVRDDSAVYVDGKPHQVDCSDLPSDFHALQWDSERKRGEIEYCLVTCDHCGGVSKKPNAITTDFSTYQKYLDAWNVAEIAVAEVSE